MLKPVIVSFQVAQATDEATLIRSNQPVRIDAVFSSTNQLSSVILEWFMDDIAVTNEARTINPMSVSGAPANGAFTVVLPGQLDRSVVRFRIRANRGTGDEVVSPRADDPYPWHAYFVTPVRTSIKPIYDCFISAASLNTLATTLNHELVPRSVGRPLAMFTASAGVIGATRYSPVAPLMPLMMMSSSFTSRQSG